MRFFAKSSLFVVTALMLLAVTPAQSAPPCPVKVSLLPDGIPDDVCPHPSDPHGAFANMAWQTFKMLVWPAASRGVPDKTRGITNSTADMLGLRVFETYKGDWETFPAGVAGPLKWGEPYPSEAKVCKNAPSGSLVLASLNKFGNVIQPDIPGSPTFGHRLMAQNGTLVRYLPAFDEKAFKMIQRYNDGDLVQPAEAGTITIKSAWVEIRDSKPDQSKFHIRTAWVQEPTGECREATFGLVGLHIVHKTKSNPQWIWASFEHVDNAPLQVKPKVAHNPPLTGFTFNDGSGELMPSDPDLQPTKPYNVERVYPVAKAIKTVNDAWKHALKLKSSVWSNYELVVVQWSSLRSEDQVPSGLAPPCFVGQSDTNMANSVMETFLQVKQVCSPSPYLTNQQKTCMGCHYSARAYDFIWAIPLNVSGSQDAGVPRTRRSALSTLREITGGNAR